MKLPLILLLFCSTLIFSQTNSIPDLVQLINTTKKDSLKVDAYNKLTWKYLFSDKEKAIETLKTTEKYALKTNQKFGYNTFLNNKGIFFDINGFSDSAKIYFEKAVAYSQKNNFSVHEQNSLNNLGMYFWNKGKYQEALNNFFKALKFAESNLKDNPLNKID